MKPRLSPAIDGFRILRDACSEAARNLGFAGDLQQLSPDHWRQVLTAVEVRAQTLGINLPDGWRKALSEQIGRTDDDAFPNPQS